MPQFFKNNTMVLSLKQFYYFLIISTKITSKLKKKKNQNFIQSKSLKIKVLFPKLM